MENSRRCENCIVDVHRASYAKDFRSKKHLENDKQFEIIMPKWLFKEEQAPIKNKTKKVNIRKPLKQIAWLKFKINHNKIDKELAKKLFIHTFLKIETYKKI